MTAEIVAEGKICRSGGPRCDASLRLGVRSTVQFWFTGRRLQRLDAAPGIVDYGNCDFNAILEFNSILTSFSTPIQSMMLTLTATIYPLASARNPLPHLLLARFIRQIIDFTVSDRQLILALGSLRSDVSFISRFEGAFHVQTLPRFNPTSRHNNHAQHGFHVFGLRGFVASSSVILENDAYAIVIILGVTAGYSSTYRGKTLRHLGHQEHRRQLRTSHTRRTRLKIYEHGVLYKENPGYSIRSNPDHASSITDIVVVDGLETSIFRLKAERAAKNDIVFASAEAMAVMVDDVRRSGLGA
ncbi:hypothetical protein BDZ89DRAFT_1041842 [Hymenopellis radicata]|nr:hypothetical protein BDZ89DRAFT_1041842 [Hymenopellis radicata]